MGMRVYVSLKKESREFAKYSICATLIVNDRDINCINQYEEDIDMRIINGGSTTDNQAIVISAPLISDELSNSIICNMNHKEVIEDQFYKNKRTLKAVMMKYDIDNRFQWKTKRSSLVRCNDLFSHFEQQILFLEKQAEATDPTTDRHGHDEPSQGLVSKQL